MRAKLYFIVAQFHEAFRMTMKIYLQPCGGHRQARYGSYGKR